MLGVRYNNSRINNNKTNVNYNVNLREGIDLGIFLGIKNEESISNINKITNINEKKIIIDIGANVGSVSLPLAKLFKNSLLKPYGPPIIKTIIPSIIPMGLPRSFLVFKLFSAIYHNFDFINIQLMTL